MDEAISFAKKYLEDVLSFFGLNVDVYATHSDEIIELNVPSTHMNGFLIGQSGDTVRALQYMVSTALKNNNHEFYRVNVDVADYKKARNERLAEQVEKWVQEVKASSKDRELRPMNSAERRVVHNVASEWGLSTESIGEGRDRRVVIKASTSEDTKETEE
jgi:spoIIIJ-associated protein